MRIISKHETILCERCHTSFECKANSSIRCQCRQVEITPEEAEYIGESFDSCLCAGCLNELKKRFIEKNRTS